MAQAFGGMPAVDSGYRRYVDKMLYMYKQLDLDVDVDQTSFTSRVLTAPEADIAIARYHVATDRPTEARARLAAALKAGPHHGAAYELEGRLLEREDKPHEALAAYARATELGGGSYYGEFRYASLAWPKAPDTTEPFAGMERSLRRSVELRPTFAPAYALLANVLLELDREAESLAPARKAVSLDPYESYHQLSLARTLIAVGKAAEAMAPAQHARRLAKSPFDVNAAEQFLKVLRSNSQ